MWPEALPPCLSQSDPNPPVPSTLKGSSFNLDAWPLGPLGLQGSQTYSDRYRVFCVGNRRNIRYRTNHNNKCAGEKLSWLIAFAVLRLTQGALRSQLITKVINGQVQSIPGRRQLRRNFKMYHGGRIGPRTAHKKEGRKTWGIQKFEKCWTFICGSVGVFVDVVGKPTAKYEDFVSFVVAICDLRCISI